MKTVLVTGATGFLGSSLVKRLVGAGYRVVCLKRVHSNTARLTELGDAIAVRTLGRESLEQIFAEFSIDTILHCATNYGRRETSPLELLEANLFLPLQLIEFGSRQGVSCFINTDTILDKRVSHYSLSKSQFTDWLRLYARGMTCINVALEHFYGPGDDETKFVTAIIRNLLRGVARIPLTRGEQKRDFIFVDDVVAAFDRIIAQRELLGPGFFSFEIGSGQLVTVYDFVNLVKRLAGNDSTVLDFGALPYREFEVMESRVDTTAIRALGWQPATTLADGLRITLAKERENL